MRPALNYKRIVRLMPDCRSELDPRDRNRGIMYVVYGIIPRSVENHLRFLLTASPGYSQTCAQTCFDPQTQQGSTPQRQCLSTAQNGLAKYVGLHVPLQADSKTDGVTTVFNTAIIDAMKNVTRNP